MAGDEGGRWKGTVALQLSIGLMTTHSDWLEAPTNKGCFRAFYHHFRHMLVICHFLSFVQMAIETVLKDWVYSLLKPNPYDLRTWFVTFSSNPTLMTWLVTFSSTQILWLELEESGADLIPPRMDGVIRPRGFTKKRGAIEGSSIWPLSNLILNLVLKLALSTRCEKATNFLY